MVTPTANRIKEYGYGALGHGEVPDAGTRGEAAPGWLRRSTDRRLPASRLEDSQIQRAYPITPGPYCGHSLQL
jgi:hypothetical protein